MYNSVQSTMIRVEIVDETEDPLRGEFRSRSLSSSSSVGSSLCECGRESAEWPDGSGEFRCQLCSSSEAQQAERRLISSPHLRNRRKRVEVSGNGTRVGVSGTGTIRRMTSYPSQDIDTFIQTREERDPESQSILPIRHHNEKRSLFSSALRLGQSRPTEVLSREEAWKLYLLKLQEEANYLLASPDKDEICLCKQCIEAYESQCDFRELRRDRELSLDSFTKDVNAMCDPGTGAIVRQVLGDSYKSLPSVGGCVIM